jgi:peptidyl-prolyl cis-trans isomerase SurA
MKHSSLFVALILFLSFISSCRTVKSPDTDTSDEQHVVATIEGQSITFDELLKGYNSNTDSNSVDIEELRAFLPSYLDYRLKILEGKRLGYFEDPDILAEYNTFAKEAAEKQWVNSDIEEQILDTFIERSQKEMLAYHILIIAQNPGYEETRDIKQKLNSAKKEIQGGVHPDSVNVKYSSVQNGNQVGGKLPWITAGRTVESFEDALYSLEAGEVSDPFQTQFGYHIIYLTDERPRTPERLVSHLFISRQGHENPGQLVLQALDSLKNGVEWNRVVEEFSDDRRTASRNGEIGWVGYGMQFPESFVDEVMKTPLESDFSEIIEMDYGYHIVKIDSVRNLSDKETLREYASDELNRLGRLQMGEAELRDLLEDIGNFRVNEKEFDEMAGYLIGTRDTLQQNSIIAEFNNSPVSAGQFLEFYKQEVGQSADADVAISTAFEQFKDRLIELNLIELTKNRFKEYRSEMDEFLNGLVVFKVNEEFLWNPDAADEKWLRDYFQQNRSDFINDQTISYQRITASSDSVIKAAREFIIVNADIDTLKASIDNIIITENQTTNANTELFQKLISYGPGEATDIENRETWHQFYYITHIEPEKLMTFDEARTDVFNVLREKHEQAYLQMLREKYQTELFPENVK